MKPAWASDCSRATLYCDDMLDVAPGLSGIDACVCDPPYGLKFMGKGWDHGIPGVPYWRAILEACKPGAHLLAFGGTRTFHRLMCSIEDAGWEIRDTIGWIYGSGFPKSLDVSKAIDKAAGAERKIVGFKGTAPDIRGNSSNGNGISSEASKLKDRLPNAVSLPATDEAKQWDGWGTALKPAWEPIIMARKPLEGTVAENVQENGCGALNIDGCRIGNVSTLRVSNAGTNGYGWGMGKPDHLNGSDEGRWPANLIHDGSEEAVAVFPLEAGAQAAVTGNEPTANGFSGAVKFGGMRARVSGLNSFRGDSGSASRFFYCAKASQQDRDEGCEDMEAKVKDAEYRQPTGNAMVDRIHGCGVKRANHHPTVKPTDLMRYLVRLVTPKGGLVLDPFMGSGSTGKAAALEGMRFIGIDRESEYVAIAQARIARELKQRTLVL